MKNFKTFKAMNENNDNLDVVTFEMTGSPKNVSHWVHKQDFVESMEGYGFVHTTLTKETDLLVAEDEFLGTGKWNRAKKFGIPIYTYEQVWEHKDRLFKQILRNKKLGIIQKKISATEIEDSEIPANKKPILPKDVVGIESYYEAAKRCDFVRNLSDIEDDSFTFIFNSRNVRIFWDEDSLCHVVEFANNPDDSHEISMPEFKELIYGL